MAKSISNDAIWEKLSEMDEKINIALSKQSTDNVSPSAQTSFNDEVITAIKEYAFILRKSNDSHFEANLKNMKMLNNNILAAKKSIDNIRLPENISINEIKSLLENRDILQFGFIRLRRTSFIIAILGILISILTILSIKLYSDNRIYQNNYYHQLISIDKLKTENDSLKVKVVEKPTTTKKRK